MKIYTLCREQYMPIPIETAWDFFSSAKNLSKITPPKLDLVIRSKMGNDPIYSGMRINYTVRPLLNIAVNWETEIQSVNAPYMFTDKQITGPYALWEHTHIFKAVEGGVNMTDEVKYALPLGWLGRIMHYLVVRKKLDEIFAFRGAVLKLLFGQYGN